MRARWFVWPGLGLAGLGMLTFGAQGVRLAGAAALLWAGLWLLGEARSRGWHARCPAWCREAVGPALLIGLAVALYGRLLAGDLPLNHDHPVMLLRAWITGTQMLPSGRLSGISPALFAGYPANTLYPMGTDLLVSGVRGLSLGWVSWQTAYCWAVFLAVLAYPLALYALGRRLAGPLAGLLAGALGLVDRGAWFEGGWDFNLNWGVWSMGLSFSLCLWSLWSTERLARTPGRLGPFLGTAASTAGAVLCHPMAVAILGTGLPLLLGVMLLTGRLGAPGLWLARVAGALGLAAALSAFWLVPFMAHQAWYEPLASAHRPYAEVLRGLLSGNLLAAMAPALALGGLVGLGLAARRGAPTAAFWLLWCGLLLFFSSHELLTDFGLLDRVPALGQLQFARFMYAVRAGLLLGCGALVQALWSSGLPTAPAPGGWRVHGLRGLAALALAPAVALSPQVGALPWFTPTRTMDWASTSPLWPDLQATAARLEALRADPHHPPGRVALLAAKDEHVLLMLPVLTGLPAFKVGFTPENNYRYKFSSRSPEVWRAVGVTHAVALGPQPGPGLAELARFGRLVLYRFVEPPLPRAVLTGPGRVELLLDEPEAIELRIEGAGPDSRLRVHAARFGLWRAELDGQPWTIEGERVDDSPEVFMALAAQDGILRLRYSNGAAEWLGRGLSALGLAIFLLLAAAAALPRLGRRLTTALERARVTAVAGLLVVLGLGAAGLGLRLVSPGPSPFPGQRVVARLAEHLPAASGQLVRPGRTEPCEPFDGLRIRCPGPEWNFSGQVLFSADQVIRQCIWLHPVEGARHEVHFEPVPLGDHVRGFCALDDRVLLPNDPRAIELLVSLDGVELGRVSCPARRGWHPWAFATPDGPGRQGRLTFASEATFTGRRHFCFSAYTTRSEEEP
jgi:hypothetical protein